MTLAALVLAATAGTAAADEPDTNLRPFRDSDEHATRIAMHLSAAPCKELGKACKVVASTKVGGMLAEVYRSDDLLPGQGETLAVMLVLHDGKQLLASPVITAGWSSKLGAYSTLDAAQVALQTVGGAAVLDLTTSNTWHEQRTTPTERIAWHTRAFAACRIADGAGTCWFAAVGGYLDPCTAVRAKDAVHVTCGDTERDIVLHDQP